MPVVLKNNAYGYLASAISATDTSILLTTGTGANFPALAASEYFYATITATAGVPEVIKVTARSTDTLTVTRGQENTAALAFPAGALVELRVTAQSVLDAIDQYSNFNNANVREFGALGDGVTDDTAAINAAIAATNASGQWLVWDKGIYRVTDSIIASVPELRWVGQSATILFDPPADITYGLRLTLTAGVEHKLVGDGLEIDGNGKCHLGFQFYQPNGSHTTTLYVEKLRVKNIEQQVAVGFGAAAMAVRGGYKYVKLVDCSVENVMMRIGAGIIGVRGVNGIQVINEPANSGAYSKHTNIVRPIIKRVYSEDAAYPYDMDGIGVFANPDIDNSLGPSFLEVSGSDCTGCWGRDIKMQVASARIDSPVSLRNEGPSGGIQNSAYDFQTGPGVLTGGQYTVDGVVCTITGPFVRFSGGPAVHPYASRWMGGSVNIINGGVLPRVSFCDSSDATPSDYVVSISDVCVRGSIQNFIWGRTNGYDISKIKLSSVTCEEVTDTLFYLTTQGGGVAPYRFKTFAYDCVNLGASVPLVRLNVPGQGARALLDGRQNLGFDAGDSRFIGSAQTLSGFQLSEEAQMPLPLDNGFNSGTQKFYSFVIDANATRTLPTHGYNLNYIAEILAGVNRTTYALLSVDNAAIAAISVGASTAIGVTSDPGSGDLRIWRLNGTSQLVIRNGTASGRVFLVRFFG
jgi:hypothetical protein